MENYSSDKIKQKLENLTIWKGNIDVKVLTGGLTNDTYLITDDKKKYVAKIGDDKIDFGIIRSQEIIAHKAAYQAGISPEVIYYKNEITVYEYLNSIILTPKEIREEKNLSKLVYLIKIIHNKVFNNLKNLNLFLDIFQMINHKVQALRKYKSLYIDLINELVDDCKIFRNESNSGKIVFTHNDFYHANLLYDGKKFWLIDWEYAGFNTDVLDLANLSKNNQLIEDEENYILEKYFGSSLNLKLIKIFQAMKCTSLANEVLWYMLAEIKSKKNFDYKSVTKEKLDRFIIEKQKFFK